MPQDRYFDKFPQITYLNSNAIDITRRVKILDNIYNNPYVFNTYDISDAERADQFSYRYYDDQFKSWIVYLSNKIVDPYYEWYLNYEEINNHITTKYESVPDAQEKIMYYRNDWVNDENIQTNTFEALPASLRKYWEPVYDQLGNILEYKRFERDWEITTNRIMSYDVGDVRFVNNEICDIVYDSRNSGKGQVITTSNTRIYVQHLSGVYQSNDTVLITGSSYVYGNESQINTVFTADKLQSNNIAIEEDVYWQPVYQYDNAIERNEFNKTIKVLDSNQSDTVVDNLRELLEE